MLADGVLLGHEGVQREILRNFGFGQFLERLARFDKVLWMSVSYRGFRWSSQRMPNRRSENIFGGFSGSFPTEIRLLGEMAANPKLFEGANVSFTSKKVFDFSSN